MLLLSLLVMLLSEITFIKHSYPYPCNHRGIRSSWVPSYARYSVKTTSVLQLQSTNEILSNTTEDASKQFSTIEKIFFQRFSASIGKEIDSPTQEISSSYSKMIQVINQLTFTNPPDIVAQKSKQILVRLFPPGLLPAYKILFGVFFPNFSAWMNTRVTAFATRWLMGPSVVQDLITPAPEDRHTNITKKEQLLFIEKCRFLEASNCIQTCLYACKIPTQNFFFDEMGLPVALQPNFQDYSCRFEFGVMPLPVELDESLKSACLSGCPCPSSTAKIANTCRTAFRRDIV